ncbi:hypothetical protein [Mariniphaga sediminis]|uniref:hypothetical protein n=1 Tax=Mariniphaga sediminis TaxID=1628158 RepID=UPI00356432B1
MDPITKRRYNTTYKLRKSGFVVDTKRKVIPVYFRQITQLVGHPHIITLVKEFNYKLVENRQLQLDI